MHDWVSVFSGYAAGAIWKGGPVFYTTALGTETQAYGLAGLIYVGDLESCVQNC